MTNTWNGMTVMNQAALRRARISAAAGGEA